MDKNEHIVWKGLRQADAAAFNTLFEMYWEPLFQYAYKILKRKEDAEELVQDLFINIWNKKEQLPEVNVVAAYMHTAMRNHVLNHLAKQKLKIVTIDHVEESSSKYAASEKIDIKESEKILALCMRSLPQKMQEVFYLHRIGELSVAEIAAQTNTSPQTVRNQLNAAYKKLRTTLAKSTPLILVLLQKKFLG